MSNDQYLTLSVPTYKSFFRFVFNNSYVSDDFKEKLGIIKISRQIGDAFSTDTCIRTTYQGANKKIYRQYSDRGNTYVSEVPLANEHSTPYYLNVSRGFFKDLFKPFVKNSFFSNQVKETFGVIQVKKRINCESSDRYISETFIGTNGKTYDTITNGVYSSSFEQN